MSEERAEEPLEDDVTSRAMTVLASANRLRKTFVGELIEVAIVALLLFFVARIAVQNFRVHGHSMLPSLHNNEFVIVDKISYDFISPQRGDIVVFRYPMDPSQDFIKRIIAVPGDRVQIHSGGVYVNGVRLHEPYIKAPYPRLFMMSTIPYTVSDVVPKGEYFVLGDNRNDSDDSHLWGLLPAKDIIGRAILSYWPPQDVGFLGDPSTSGK